MTLPACWTAQLPRPDSDAIERALARQQVLTKPPGSLGRLEQAAIELCGQQGRDRPAVDAVHISIFAGDHGVCDEGVSAFPQAVTAQMIANFSTGGAAISVLARQLDAQLEVVNLGTVGDVPSGLPGVIDERIADSTRNLAIEAAMSSEEVAAALTSGDRAAARAQSAGAELFIAGDMGIGNTTSAAAIACRLLGAQAENIVGAGTGLTQDGISRKARVVTRALKRHGDDTTPLSVLTSLGGFEIAAMAGGYLGAASRRIPLLVDGFIASVAALVALLQQPDLAAWMHFAHRSAERGHLSVLEAMNARPLIDLDLRLGEASGAAVAVSLLQSACALHNNMASFADAGVSNGN